MPEYQSAVTNVEECSFARTEGGDYQFCLVKPGPKKSMRFDMRDNTHSSPSRKLNWENILFLRYNFDNFISMVCLWVCDYNVVKTPFFTAVAADIIQSSHHFHTNFCCTKTLMNKIPSLPIITLHLTQKLAMD